jgi:NADH-quinone oxidoreductase subunit F
MKKILSKNFDKLDSHLIKNALSNGAYSSLKKLFQMNPAEVVEEVKRSGLRGRGGAGFPTGVKWSFIPKNTQKPVYLVVNADESEPGTFKDRAILEKDPHLLIEGIIIAAYAIGAETVYVYFRGEYYRQWEGFFRALREAELAGFTGNIKIYPHRGAGAYICGEETALLNSIEGRRGLPRIRPPFPAVEGLFGCPTIVNNVETLSSLPFIINEGASAYAAIGTEKSKGTKLISVCGHVAKPGVYEIEMGMPVALFLSLYAGGTLNERAIKAVIPGGSSVPVMTSAEALGSRLSYESLEAAGSMLGSGGMIVIDESACMVRVLADIAKFYHHESCGQCTPCREGCGWIKKICDRIEDGLGREGDLELLLRIADNMQGKTICVFADALAMPVRSFITKFRSEFEEHIKSGKCIC